MPTSSAGKISSRGVTLLEMLIVVGIISLIAGLTYPALTAGVDSLRLNAASRSIVSFFNTGLNRAERRQQAIQVTIDQAGNFLFMRSTDPSFARKLAMPGTSADRSGSFPSIGNGVRSISTSFDK